MEIIKKIYIKFKIFYKFWMGLIKWHINGKPVPAPHSIKKNIIKKVAKDNNIKVFVETGTFKGQMIHMCRNYFDKIFSIEIDDILYNKAVKRFSSLHHINIIKGDSSEKLQEIIKDLKDTSIFWLDGHYSGGDTGKGILNTPIIKELEAIFESGNNDNIILIDDARCFIGKDDYPTIKELKKFISQYWKKFYFEIKHDVIIISRYPQNKKISLKNKIKNIILGKKDSRLGDLSKWRWDSGDNTSRIFYNLNKDSIVFDVGGYYGHWTSEIYSMYNSQIHVFEPLRQYYEYIEKKFSQNQKIKVHKYGLGRESKEEMLSIDDDASSLFANSEDGKEKVFVKDIGDFIKQNKINKIDLIKINIEGGEYDLLERLIEIGFIDKIKNLQIQFHNFVPNAEERMKKIQDSLSKTHQLSYQYKFVWENWERIK